MCSNTKQASGFTLLELIVAISIAAVLMALAIPSFRDMMRNNQLTTSTNELVTALNLARSEAVKRGMQVTIRRKGATSKQWESGWDVFIDSNGNNTFNDDGDSTLCEATEDCLLRSYNALPSGYTLRTDDTKTYKDYVIYTSSGLRKIDTSVGDGNDTFRLCNGIDTSLSRAIAINSIGRARVSTGTASCP